MADDRTIELQDLIDRIRLGQPAARRELIDRAYERLRKLAAKLLHGSFPGLVARHELDSIAHEGWIRLAQAIEAVETPTVADFFRLAAFKIRQVLLDLADKQRRRATRERVGLTADSQGEYLDPGGTTYDPSKLAEWTEFHACVSNLPPDELAVFEMHYYLGLTQAEIARLTDRQPRQVSYLWVAATDRLAERMGNLGG